MKNYISRKNYTLFQNKWCAVCVRVHGMVENEPEEYVYFERPSSVVIVPVSGDSILLVSQYRAPVKQITWELPSGSVESGESIDDAAIRELSEETGLIASRYQWLGQIYEAPAYSTVALNIFLAQIPKEAMKVQEDCTSSDKEIRSWKWFDKQTLRAQVIQKAQTDASTIAALGFAHFL